MKKDKDALPKDDSEEVARDSQMSEERITLKEARKIAIDNLKKAERDRKESAEQDYVNPVLGVEQVRITSRDIRRVILLTRRIKWEYEKTPQAVTEAALEILEILTGKDGEK